MAKLAYDGDIATARLAKFEDPRAGGIVVVGAGSGIPVCDESLRLEVRLRQRPGLLANEAHDVSGTPSSDIVECDDVASLSEDEG